MSRPAPGNTILDWYRAMGVDEVIADTPGDRFVEAPAETPARIAVTVPVATAPQSPPPDDPGETDAETHRAVADAQSLEDLRSSLAAFDGCALKATATKLCFYRGVADSRVMLIGEAPGRDEDLQGEPFVGRAGRLLDKMLAAIDLDDSKVHITNVVYWRPPGNRTPNPQEVQACAPFLDRQIALVDPEFLVFLGGAAAKQMLGTSEGIMRLRGKWRTLAAGGAERRALATLHPAYLLRNPIAKRLAWRDLLSLREALENID